jgi:3'-5' exonuclease
MGGVVAIDIETLPAPVALKAGEETPERNYGAEDYLKTALNGDFGQILCIGYADERANGTTQRGVIGWDESFERFTNNERELLIEFWEMLRGFRTQTDRIVGHNIFEFDLKFIYKRSVIHGVRPSVDLSFARYRSQPIFDTMCEWERWSYRDKISLDKLAKVLGLPSSKAEGVNGSRVFELYQAGEHRAIRDYCMRDVELTREIYRRLVFADASMSSNSSMPSMTTRKVFSLV